MTIRNGLHGLMMLLALLATPIAAGAHEILPWGVYPTLGDVTVATKGAKLLDGTFLAQTMTVEPIVPSYFGTLGPGRPDIGGVIAFPGAKPARAKLTVGPALLDDWITEVKTLVQQYRERKGDTVLAIDATTKSSGGTATFKTKPTPIGPLHKMTMHVVAKFDVTVMLNGNRTRHGTVTLTVHVKGARLGTPGD